MKIFKIYSDFDCVLENNNQQIFLDKFGCIELESNHDKYLKVFPVHNSNDYYSLPFLMDLTKSESFYDMKDFYQINLTEKIVAKSYSVMLSKTYGKTRVEVTSFPHFVSVFNGETNFSYKIKGKIENPEISQENGIAKLCFDIKDEMHTVCFHFQEKKFYEFCGKEINFNAKKITVKSVLDDIAKHAKIEEYEIDNDSIKKVSSELFYTKKEPKIVTNKKLIGLAFFQAIMQTNFSLAKSYMTQSLNQRLSDKHLSKFFDDFDEIKSISANKVALLKTGNSVPQIFNLVFENNSISNILQED